MPMVRNTVDHKAFNRALTLPYELRLEDFQLPLQDAYDFFFDVHSHLTGKGLQRLDDMLRPAIMSSVLSDSTKSVTLHTRKGLQSFGGIGYTSFSAAVALVSGKPWNRLARHLEIVSVFFYPRPRVADCQTKRQVSIPRRQTDPPRPHQRQRRANYFSNKRLRFKAWMRCQLPL